MKIGIGLALITLGAILRYAVDDDIESVDLGIVGLILMLVGLAAFATGVALEFWKRPAAKVPPSAPPAAQPPSQPVQPVQPPKQ
jgi:hypothetical protein